MHVRTYSTDFAPPHFAAGGIPKKHPTWHNGKSHCLHLYFVCLPLPGGVLREARDVDTIIVTVCFFARLGIATVTWDELLYTENVFRLACSFLAVRRKTITCIQHGMAIICPPIV